TAAYAADGKLDGPALAGDDMNNADYHIGPVSRAPSGELIVTRTHSSREGDVSREQGKRYRTNTLELYMYNEGPDGWTAEPFAYNNVREYSVGHATVTADGQTLYFVSDMP